MCSYHGNTCVGHVSIMSWSGGASKGVGVSNWEVRRCIRALYTLYMYMLHPTGYIATSIIHRGQGRAGTEASPARTRAGLGFPDRAGFLILVHSEQAIPKTSIQFIVVTPYCRFRIGYPIVFGIIDIMNGYGNLTNQHAVRSYIYKYIIYGCHQQILI